VLGGPYFSFCAVIIAFLIIHDLGWLYMLSY
jgi:hypothetical protein